MTDEVSGYRSYEVYQRERVGETTNLVNPRDLIGEEYLLDPFTVSGVLRENYPCYRDWVGNRFWISRYDDVTSVFADDANFESRSPLTAYGSALTGRNLAEAPEIQEAWVEQIDAALETTIQRLLDDLTAAGPMVDLAVDFADAFAIALLGEAFGLSQQMGAIALLARQVRAGTGWSEQDRVAGMAAWRELRPQIAAELTNRRAAPAGDLLTVFADLDARSDDVAASLVSLDVDTLPASLANLWSLLLTHPTQFAAVKTEPRLMKFAYLEALRHSPPVITADRFARHEVERFGRLVPQGAMLHLSAGAANRDPRQFARPDDFDIARKDLCQREPRGHYRADGLPSGITFGHGKPSRLPAMPRDAPRSRYALTRDVAVAASLALLDRFPDIALIPGSDPTMSLDRRGGIYRCRSLPVRGSAEYS